MTNLKNSVIFALLMVLAVSVSALQPPKLLCFRLLDNNTHIHVDWESNPDCVRFKVYHFYVNGVLSATLENIQPPQTLFDLNGIDIDNFPTADQYQCYIDAIDSFDNHFHSDTLQSIKLTVTANSDRTAANLVWQAPTTNFNNTWGNTFKLYKKHSFDANFPIQPFDSVPVTQTNYTDPSDVCDDSITYQVGISHYYMNATNLPCDFKTNSDTVQHMVDRTNPARPVLDSVSVIHSPTGDSVMLGFHSTEPYMKAFVIYYEKTNPNGSKEWDSLFTIFNQTYWIDPDIDPNNDVRYYRIAAMDSCDNIGAMSDSTKKQCNMVLHLNSTDACRKSATIQWATYPNLINEISHYEIMLSDDGGMSWNHIGDTTANNFEIKNLQYNQDYTAYVRVVNNGATVTASSNRVTIQISAETAEDFTYIRSVSVIDNKYIQIKVLTSGDTLPFETLTLQRSEDNTTFENLMTLRHRQGVANYIFRDSLAKYNKKTYYYRTFVTNHCHTDTGYSNISHNILLQGENNAQTNILIWPSYDNWDGEVSDYYVMRKMENEDSFNAIANEASSTNNYTDDISQLFEFGSKFTYYIEARENTNHYGFGETSYSNHVTVIQPPSIFLSNAFRPMGGDNNVFKPINSFVSIDHYSFSIFTRTGERIFFTTNPQEGWDGKIKGVLVPMGVYIYYLEFQMPDGTIMERTGTVTLIK